MTNKNEQGVDMAARVVVLRRLDEIRRLEEMLEQPPVIWNGNHRHNDLHLPFEHYTALLEMAAFSTYLLARKGVTTDEEIADASRAIRRVTRG